MIKIDDIYARTTGYLIQHIHVHWCMQNSQHSMFAHPDFNNILIDNYNREILLTFMLADGVYITRSST